MLHRYFLLLAGFVLATFNAWAQSTHCATPTNLLISNITATSATLSFSSGSTATSSASVSYSYDSLAWQFVATAASPVTLTGLLPGHRVIVRITRRCTNPVAAGPSYYNSLPATTAFTTATALATRAATEADAFALAPNPAQHRVTLTLAAPLRQPCFVQVLDALGRPVRQQQLPAQASTALLELSGLPAGLYVVRCGSAASRLVVAY